MSPNFSRQRPDRIKPFVDNLCHAIALLGFVHLRR